MRSGQDLAAELRQPARHYPGHFCVIDDAGAGRQDGTEPGDVWLDRPELCFAEQFDLDAVLQRALVQGEHALVLSGVRRYDQLAALFVPDIVVPAEAQGCRKPFAAQFGFKAARFVVDAGVDYTAVMAALVAGYGGFLFDDDEASGRLPLAQLQRRGQANDAATNDREVVHPISVSAEPGRQV